MKQLGAIISPPLGGDRLVDLDCGQQWEAREDLHGQGWLHGPADAVRGPFESVSTAIEWLLREFEEPAVWPEDLEEVGP